MLALDKVGAVRAARDLAARAAEQVQVSAPAAVIRLAEAMRDVGAAQDSLSLMRKAIRMATSHGIDYSAIQDYFTVIESAGLRVTATTLLYGPGPGAQKSHPWAWGDLVGSEQE